MVDHFAVAGEKATRCSALMTAGQMADCGQADALTEVLGAGSVLLADKGYDTDAIRAKATERKA